MDYWRDERRTRHIDSPEKYEHPGYIDNRNSAKLPFPRKLFIYFRQIIFASSDR